MATQEDIDRARDLAYAIGCVLLRLKRESRLGVRELAKRCGTSMPAICRAIRVRPKHVHTVQTLAMFANVFGVSITDIVSEAEERVREWHRTPSAE